jgi:hypothetical protein
MALETIGTTNRISYLNFIAMRSKAFPTTSRVSTRSVICGNSFCVSNFSLIEGPGVDKSARRDSTGMKKKKTGSFGGSRRPREQGGQKSNRVGPHPRDGQKVGDGSAYDADESDPEEVPCGYHEAPIHVSLLEF